MQADLAERFWSKVEKTDGCWLWRGSKSVNGYARLNVKKKIIIASRLSYELAYGEELGDRQLLRTCPNRNCVRPDHWIPATGNHICPHCHRSDDRLRKRHQLCRMCVRWQLLYGRLPPRRIAYDKCRCCGRPKAAGVRFLTKWLCDVCYNYRRKHGVERPQHLIAKRVPHGWCDCGKPAVTVQTFQFGKQKETFRLCQECSE